MLFRLNNQYINLDYIMRVTWRELEDGDILVSAYFQDGIEVRQKITLDEWEELQAALEGP